jgi:hypothetical protein
MVDEMPTDTGEKALESQIVEGMTSVQPAAERGRERGLVAADWHGCPMNGAGSALG